MTEKSGGYLHNKLARSIGERILGGEFAPGALLPNEAEWGKVFGTSRTAVREALKTLIAKGLIISRPKIGSRVQPRSEWNILDRDVLDWHHSAIDRREFIQSTQEVRRLVEPGVASLAAQKRTSTQLAQLTLALDEMKSAKTHLEAVKADVNFHEALMAAANNELLLPFGIIIEKALATLFDFTTQRNPRYKAALKMHEAILRAVTNSNSKAAFTAMSKLLEDTDEIIAGTAKAKLRKI